MKDYLGNNLEIGDEVVYITPGYRDYSKGIIKRFTNKYVFLSLPDKNKWNNEIKQFPEQLIKIINNGINSRTN